MSVMLILLAATCGGTVQLETDVQRQDRYGWLLAYVHLPEGGTANEAMLRAGLAVVSIYAPNVRNADRYRAVADSERRGLWSFRASVVRGPEGDGRTKAVRHARTALIGRYLYGIEESWPNVHERGRFRGRTKEGTVFRWDAPELPTSALQANGMRSQPTIRTVRGAQNGTRIAGDLNARLRQNSRDIT